MKFKLISLAAALIAAQANAGTVTTEGSDLIINTKSGLEIKTADEKASFKLGGRIQWDYNNSEKNGVTDESDFDVRRARIYTKGHYGDWGYKAQFNIDESTGSSAGTVEDLYIQYKGFGDLAKITIGRAKQPLGLEELTSSKDISILERSAITEMYALGRQEGIKLDGKTGIFTYSFGAFEDDDETKKEASSLGFGGRVTAAPINENGSVLHFGLGYADRGNSSSINDVYGLELAGVAGPFHAQAEFYDADMTTGDSKDGYYVQLGWILTGESRPYKDGKFKIVKPSADTGAWEVVARYEDGDGDFGDIELGEDKASAYTVGLNWYATKNVRLGVNYTEGESDTSSDDGSEFRTRLQLVF